MTFTEFNVIVLGNISCNIPITEKRAYSELEARDIAQKFSLRYPDSQIVIDEWKFIQSNQFLKSGLYKGKRIYYSPEAAA